MPSHLHTRQAAVAGSALALVASFGATTMLGTAGAATPKLAATTPAAQSVRAVETEYHIALSRTTFHAGRVTFTAVNKGKIEHGLIVDGPGEQDKLIGLVKPGHSATKTLTLRKGKYEVYCPVSDHKMLGMSTHITVS